MKIKNTLILVSFIFAAQQDTTAVSGQEMGIYDFDTSYSIDHNQDYGGASLHQVGLSSGMSKVFKKMGSNFNR